MTPVSSSGTQRPAVRKDLCNRQILVIETMGCSQSLTVPRAPACGYATMFDEERPTRS
jgi:hypothetical protein